MAMLAKLSTALPPSKHICTILKLHYLTTDRCTLHMYNTERLANSLKLLHISTMLKARYTCRPIETPYTERLAKCETASLRALPYLYHFEATLMAYRWVRYGKAGEI